MEALALDQATLDAISHGEHGNPFAVLGVHQHDTGFLIRTFQPHVDSVSLISKGSGDQHQLTPLQKVNEGGIYELQCSQHPGHYQLELSHNGYQWQTHDAYSFASDLGDMDLYLFGEGTHTGLYQLLGAHCKTINGIDGVRFVVWAPSAKQVNVIGSFNDWDRRRHTLRLHPGTGLWEIFIPGAIAQQHYKYAIQAGDGRWLPHKADPVAQFSEAPPGNASVVYQSHYEWQDSEWQSERGSFPDLSKPISIYEVHAGSWQWTDGRMKSYRELADSLIPYVLDAGFTHIEFMPLSEHPFNASWGYQPTGLYSPTYRFGQPDDLRYLVDQCHLAGIGVIMDWVPGHFPSDDHGLAQFDGTHLYEHADPRQGFHQDWNTLIYNYGRVEVRNFLVANALYWIHEFHLDGLRVDAVASMLYLDYSREDGQWIPNQHGSNENLEAIAFLQQVNERVHESGAITLAEESTAWGGVSKPVYLGGLGFTYKWNMGWMNDTLDYFKLDPIHRRYHQDQLTFSIMYAFTENFALPFSHDEVVHGKGSLIQKMAGDPWQKRANLRCCYAMMYAHPGKKLLFMGAELGQYREWSHDRELDWHLLDDPAHQGIRETVKSLNRLYRDIPALHQYDCDGRGFEWIDCDDRDQSVLSWYRFGDDDAVVVVCNLTPVVREHYRLGVNQRGRYEVIFNSDDQHLGGSGISFEAIDADEIDAHQRPFSLSLTLPPLATIMLKPT